MLKPTKQLKDLGDGLTGGSGSALAVGLDSDGGLEFVSSEVAIKKNTSPGANEADVLNLGAGGVSLAVDDSTIGENGSGQLEVSKLLAAFVQIDNFASGTSDRADVDTAVTGAATTDTATTAYTSKGVGVDASADYGAGSAGLPSPVQVTEQGLVTLPGLVRIRESTSKDVHDDGSGNEVYGVLFFNTNDSLYYIRYFSDVSATQTAYTFSSGINLDLQFEEVFDFATLAAYAFMVDHAGWMDLAATGDISGVTAGDGLQGGGASGDVTLDVDVSDFAGTGLEDDGSENLRLAAQGNGIAGGAGSTLSVDSDTETGGNIQGANITANGVGLDVNAIAGTGVEADGSANLRLAAQGDGIAGGAGSTLSVDSDTETGGNIVGANITANGVGLDVSGIAGVGLSADGSGNLDVDGLLQAVETVADANVTLSGEQTLDGILTSTSRVLLTGQSTPSENGIYVTAAGAWARASDMPATLEAAGYQIQVMGDGTKYGGATFVVDEAAGDGTVGTDALTITQIDGRTGTSITRSSTTQKLEVAPDETGGANLATVGDVNSNGLAVRVDDSTIEDDGNGATAQLRVKAGGITSNEIGANEVNDTHIDWGSGANQVDADDVPTGSTWGGTATDVDAALEENRNAISAASDPAIADPVYTVADSNITLSGEQTIDGKLTAASRVLVIGQGTGSENGIYVSAAGAWTRASDFAVAFEAHGVIVAVEGDGTNYGGALFVVDEADGDATVGTDAITFTEIDARLGNSVERSATQRLEVKPDETGGANLATVGDVNSNGLALRVDDSTIEDDGNGATAQLRVKDAGITEAHLNTSVAGDGIVGGAGTPLAADLAGDAVAIDTGAIVGWGFAAAVGNPSVTSGEDQDSSLTPTITPRAGGRIIVEVNGDAQRLGDGTKTGVDCFYSDTASSPFTALALSAVSSSSKLIWNGNTAGFDLAASDVVIQRIPEYIT